MPPGWHSGCQGPPAARCSTSMCPHAPGRHQGAHLHVPSCAQPHPSHITGHHGAPLFRHPRTVPSFALHPPRSRAVPHFAHRPLSRAPSPHCVPSPSFTRHPHLGCGTGNRPETRWWGARLRSWGHGGWDAWGGGLGQVVGGHIGMQWWGLKAGAWV